MTMSVDDSVWLTARLTATEAMIIAYETAMLALSTGSQSYSLDTGQTRQTVTKSDLGTMRLTLKMLEERREELRAKLGLTSLGLVTRVVPGW